MNKKTELILPVYLNQRVVFDFVGMTEGGISNVETVTSSSTSQTATNREIGSSFGLNNAFSSLFKIGLDAKKEDSNSDNIGQTVQKQVVHTPASLFFKLRNSMLEKGVINSFKEGYRPTPGDIIEFQCQLKNNPLLETLTSFDELLDLMKSFGGLSKDKNKKQGTEFDVTSLKKQIGKFRESLGSSSVDLVAQHIPGSNFKSMITLEKHFLNDPNMSDLVEGTFSILGKVIHVIDESDSINLMRKTALSKIPQQYLEQMVSGLNGMGEMGFNLPKVELEIKGPMIQVLPIAIFS